MEYFSDISNCLYLHLNSEEKEDLMKKIIEEYKQPNKSYLYYEKKRNKLPDGFLRDYGCGMSSHDNIFHMNMDCIYHPKSIERKINFTLPNFANKGPKTNIPALIVLTRL